MNNPLNCGVYNGLISAEKCQKHSESLKNVSNDQIDVFEGKCYQILKVSVCVKLGHKRCHKKH